MKNKPDVKFAPSRAELDAWNTQAGELQSDESLGACMKLLACIVDEYDAKQMDRLPCLVYHRALNWLATLKARLESFKAVAYESCLSDSDGKPIPGTGYGKYMVYNTAVIGDAEAEKLLQQGRQDTDRRVVDLWPEQAFALFPSLRPEIENPDEEADKNV